MKTRMGRVGRAVAVVTALGIVIALGVMLQFVHGDRICKGVSVAGIDLSGLTVAEAKPLVQPWAVRQSNRSVTLTALDRRWTGTLASLGVRADWQDAVNRAYQIGRKDFSPNSIICVLTRVGAGKHIVPKTLIDRAKLGKTLSKVARAVNRPHTDARIRVVDERIVVEQDSCGIKLDEKAAVGAVASDVGLGQNIVRLPIVTDNPVVRAQDAVGIDTLLARYTTSFNPGKRGRTHNLTLASRSIDGLVLRPGQVFSYNSAVGPRLTARGFQTAQVFIRGKLEDGIGGGVCQVSSTLFNAALLAGLKIVERNPHSQIVPYVRPGRDATVAYGLLDFRFENSNAAPIGIVSTVKGARLTVDVYGSGSDRKTVKVYLGPAKRTPAGSKTVTDTALGEGTTRVVEKGASGCDVVLYRQIASADGQAKVEAIRSRYAPRNAVIAVGAAAKPTVE